MIKELFAVLLLISLLLLTLFNISYLDGIITEIMEHIEISEKLATDSDFAASTQELLLAIERWKDASHYASILLRYTDIEDTSGVFYELLSDLYAEDGNRSKASYEKLRSHMHGISDMERLSMWSIF